MPLLVKVMDLSQAVTGNNADLWPIGPTRTYLLEYGSRYQMFFREKLVISSAKCRSSSPCPSVLQKCPSLMWQSARHVKCRNTDLFHLVWDMKSSQRIMSCNSAPPGQNVRHFADDIFKCIFVNEKFCILIKISLKFIPDGPIDKIQHWFKWWLGAE